MNLCRFFFTKSDNTIFIKIININKISVENELKTSLKNIFNYTPIKSPTIIVKVSMTLTIDLSL